MESGKFAAWAAYGVKEDLKPFSYIPRPLGAHDVEIGDVHCGICAFYVHQIDSGWDKSIYPIVPGEIISVSKKNN